MVEAWSETDANGVGRALIGEVGERVCAKPMPPMRLFVVLRAGVALDEALARRINQVIREALSARH